MWCVRVNEAAGARGIPQARASEVGVRPSSTCRETSSPVRRAPTALRAGRPRDPSRLPRGQGPAIDALVHPVGPGQGCQGDRPVVAAGDGVRVGDRRGDGEGDLAGGDGMDVAAGRAGVALGAGDAPVGMALPPGDVLGPGV